MMIESNEFILFKYTPDSDPNLTICNEARGIILDKNTWNIACCPFFRFFNYSEEFADKIEEPFHVYEKIDGSLMKVWCYNGAWHLSTNGAIDARTAMLNKTRSFYDLFMHTLQYYCLNWEYFTSKLNPDYTYMYELATQENTVIIPYFGYHLYYLGQRNVHTYKEEYIPTTIVENVRSYDIATIDDVVRASKHLSDDEEGYVVRDNAFRRVKVKNPRYFLMHNMYNNGKPDLVDAVIEHNESEILAYFPRFAQEIETIKHHFAQIEESADYYHNFISAFYYMPRKNFAEEVKLNVPKVLHSYIFSTYGNRAMSWKDYTANWDTSTWRRYYDKWREYKQYKETV